jgi:WD40 repeat protein
MTGAEVLRLTHEDSVHRAAFSAGGARVLTASADRIVRVWGAATGVEIARLAHDDWVTSAAISPDGACVASACGNTAQLWRIFTPASPS